VRLPVSPVRRRGDARVGAQQGSCTPTGREDASRFKLDRSAFPSLAR
jgi:hypothetical protein